MGISSPQPTIDVDRKVLVISSSEELKEINLYFEGKPEETKLLKLKSVNSVEDGYEFLSKEENRFILIYIIITDSYVEKFLEDYSEKMKKLPLVTANIIFSKKIEIHKAKYYYEDPYLNPGGVISNIENVFKYIKLDENNWAKIINGDFIPLKKLEKMACYGYVFKKIEDIKDLAFELLFQDMLQNYSIYYEEIKEFKSLVNAYKSKELNNLSNPEQEKKLVLPIDTYAKYFTKMYTLESDFYGVMNNRLTNGLIDEYRVYIFIFINSLKLGILINNSEDTLYRGGRITKEEYEDISKDLKKTNRRIHNKIEGYKEINKENPIITYYSKTFLSFSKDRNIALDFLKNSEDSESNRNTVKVLFILEKDKYDNSKDYFTYNLDIDKIGYSKYEEEKEVLILPYCCFEITKITSSEIDDFYEIHLKNIGIYRKKFDDIIKESNRKDSEEILKKVKENENYKSIKIIDKDILENGYNNYIIGKKTEISPQKIILENRNQWISITLKTEEKPVLIYHSPCIPKEGLKTIIDDINCIDGRCNPYQYFPKSGKHTVKFLFNREVKSLNNMFEGCQEIIKFDFGTLNIETVESFEGMFKDCKSLIEISSSRKWRTVKPKFIKGMFQGCESLENISFLEKLDLQSVLDMSDLFFGCKSLRDISPIKNWNTEKVEYMQNLFYCCFNICDIKPLENWNTTSVKDMGHLFHSTSIKDVDALGKWKLENVTNIDGMFNHCTKLTNINGLVGWNVQNVESMKYLFFSCESLKSVDALNNWNTKNLKNIESLFGECVALKTIDCFRFWDTSKFEKIDFFLDCTYDLSSITLKRGSKLWKLIKEDNSPVYLNTTTKRPTIIEV